MIEDNELFDKEFCLTITKKLITILQKIHNKLFIEYYLDNSCKKSFYNNNINYSYLIFSYFQLKYNSLDYLFHKNF